MARFRQGFFKPRNPQKYLGDSTKIRYMSSWEQKFQEFLDSNEHVVGWASEEFAIPYLKPTDNKVHKYFPDFYVRYRDKQGNIREEVIEVKPRKQTQVKKRADLYEQLMFAVNVAKWSAAQEFCKQRGMVFRIITEEQLFPKPVKPASAKKVRKNGN